MTAQEAIDYINSYTWSQWKLGLERVRTLLAQLGDPQKQLRFVHIAGSNGKGSASAMLESILRAAGLKTGFFPSPYIEDFRERIQANGEMIPEEALGRITARVREAADQMEDHPSQFELVTAIGMLYFLEAACDLVVLEVGLGGAFDATNVIDAPEAAVLMHIGLEHTEYLGNTLEAIAETKCGIIKPGSSVVCYPNPEAVRQVVRRAAEKNGCDLHEVNAEDVQAQESSLEGQTFFWKPTGETYGLALTGRYQLYNAATVLTVVDVLRKRGWHIPEAAVQTGLQTVRWPARFEVLRRDPLFILDGGHNPQCAEALAESIRSEVLPLYPEGKVVFLIGLLADKDAASILTYLIPFAGKVFCVTPDSVRALPAETLAERIRDAGIPAAGYPTIREGLENALSVGEKENRPVIAFGSLYMAGAIRKTFFDIQKSRKSDSN